MAGFAGRRVAMRAWKMAAAIYALVGLCALLLIGNTERGVFGMGPEPLSDTVSRVLGMPWILVMPSPGSATEALIWDAASMSLNVLVIIGLGCLWRARR
jgi:hypothetical protein